MSADHLSLAPGEWIATAYYDGGILWVVIGSRAGAARIEAVQRERQSIIQEQLRPIAEVVHRELLAAVSAAQAPGAPRSCRWGSAWKGAPPPGGRAVRAAAGALAPERFDSELPWR